MKAFVLEEQKFALTEQAREKALHILRTNRTRLEDGARKLLEKETLLAEELPQPEPYTH